LAGFAVRFAAFGSAEARADFFFVVFFFAAFAMLESSFQLCRLYFNSPACIAHPDSLS
jgi:hypothetical protein